MYAISNKDFHNDGIDVLRGISILSVLLLHCYIHMPLPNDLLSPSVTNIVFRSGYYGVILFFVISGFLITITSLERWGSLKKIQWDAFYTMRFARIMPCLLGLLTILSILDMLKVPGFIIENTSLPTALYSVITFQFNWLEAKIGYLPGSWDILWSLSIEEFFYLLFPILCLILKRNHLICIPMILLVVVGPLARTQFTDNDLWSDHSYLSCMDGIAIGCLAALYSYYFRIQNKSLLIIFSLGVLFFILVFFFRTFISNVGISKLGLNVTILELSTALIIIATQEWYVRLKHRSTALSALFRWLGRNSYEIYLTHMIIITFMSNLLYHSQQSISLKLVWYSLALLLSGIVGQIVSAYFSIPMRKVFYAPKYTKSLYNKII